VWVGALIALIFFGRALAGSDSDLVKKGQYLATAGDCVACHTAPGGKPLAGGLTVSTPFGPMVTPNITPDKETGIGGYSDDQFYKAMHDGIGADGDYLYPVFPFQWYTRVSRDDVLAIKAYLFSLEPVHAEQKVNQLRFPFNIRASLVGWRELFFKAGEFTPDTSKSAEINRGKYLVTGLGHCGECHTAHNSLGGTEKTEAYQGAVIDGWYAPNITSDIQQGIGGWSDAQLVSYLKTGIAPGKGIVAGPMAQVVTESLSKLTDGDIKAIAAYLKSIPAKESFPDTRPTTAADKTPPGAGSYATFCASCHQVDGSGVAGVVPELKGNGSVLAKGPEDVIRVVLGGLPAKANYAPMPAIGSGMTDQQIAEVVNYVRSAWTNRAPDNAGPGTVGDLRKKTNTMLAGGDCTSVPTALADPKSGIAPLLGSISEVDMLNRVGQIVTKAKAADPHAGNADLVNGLTAAYCPILKQDAAVAPERKPEQLATFSQLVYSRVVQPHERW
jgi:mono/diheme cytochrome c family protein